MRTLIRFFILSFILFWVAFGLAGLLIAVGAPSSVVEVWKVIMAWAPNVAFVLIYRRLGDSRPLSKYIAQLFAVRIRLVPLLTSVLLPLAVAAAVVGMLFAYRGTRGTEILANITLSGVMVQFLNMVPRGTLGEELGWRGYAFIELNKRYSILGSSLILGLLWGVWHLPLWFLTSGYAGAELALYILFFLVSIVSFSVVIGFVYQGRKGNLIYPIILHQMLNFATALINADALTVMGLSSALYLIITAIMAFTAPARRVNPDTA